MHFGPLTASQHGGPIHGPDRRRADMIQDNGGFRPGGASLHNVTVGHDSDSGTFARRVRNGAPASEKSVTAAMESVPIMNIALESREDASPTSSTKELSCSDSTLTGLGSRIRS
ncbi:uncharacterized protein PV07_11881 [Cladophialophora immunda]|uniref:Uncharacterized protein n=1 Tax=Cladophialophora immunda TaxID=569365 RepID=A0A0D2AFQ7_9EURO|nr:uncharacterized protein PV07_11881 [Cladophialophora immunda]KIW23702.1 hypothetical protein PV07_11881 [Cladophialophora immunda]